jgi:hypothetical protein
MTGIDCSWAFSMASGQIRKGKGLSGEKHIVEQPKVRQRSAGLPNFSVHPLTV